MPLEFSVIIPTRNRPAQLAACLESLATIDYPRDECEVVAVDDGSHVALNPILAQFAERLSLRLVRTNGVGPGPARNRGAAEARGKWLAFTDDDCTVAIDWLRKLRDRLQGAPDHLIGGRVCNAFPDNLYSEAWHTVTDAGRAYYDPQTGRAHSFPSINLALSADRFRAVGGFAADWHLSAAEDREFCWRWLQRGWEMTSAPEAVVYHSHAFNFRSFCEVYFRYGRGAYRYHQLRGRVDGAGGLRPDWHFYASCFGRPFVTNHSLPRSLAIASLLGVWQFMNAAGYFAERVHHHRELARGEADDSADKPDPAAKVVNQSPDERAD